jgi:cytochrome c
MRVSLLFIPLLLLHIPIVSHAAAIHDAAMEGDVAAITAALDAGADVDESDGSATPLYIAVFMGHIQAAKLLMERGADVNAQTALGSPLMAAMGKDKIDLLNLLLDGGANPNSEGSSQPALHVAVNLGCLDCVKALVEAGADVNARAEDGKTPLHLATRSKQREVADYLMSHGVVLPTPAPISTKFGFCRCGERPNLLRPLVRPLPQCRTTGREQNRTEFVECRWPRQGISGNCTLL